MVLHINAKLLSIVSSEAEDATCCSTFSEEKELLQTLTTMKRLQAWLH